MAIVLREVEKNPKTRFDCTVNALSLIDASKTCACSACKRSTIATKTVIDALRSSFYLSFTRSGFRNAFDRYTAKLDRRLLCIIHSNRSFNCHAHRMDSQLSLN